MPAYSDLATGFQIELVISAFVSMLFVALGAQQAIAGNRARIVQGRKLWTVNLNLIAAAFFFLGSVDPQGFFSGDNAWGRLADSRFFFWMAGNTMYFNYHIIIYSILLGSYSLLKEKVPVWLTWLMVLLPIVTTICACVFTITFAAGYRNELVLFPVYMTQSASVLVSFATFLSASLTLRKHIWTHHLAMQTSSSNRSSSRDAELVKSITKLNRLMALTSAISISLLAMLVVVGVTKLRGDWIYFPSFNYRDYSLQISAISWIVMLFFPVSFWYAWVPWTRKRVSPSSNVPSSSPSAQRTGLVGQDKRNTTALLANPSFPARNLNSPAQASGLKPIFVKEVNKRSSPIV